MDGGSGSGSGEGRGSAPDASLDARRPRRRKWRRPAAVAAALVVVVVAAGALVMATNKEPSPSPTPPHGSIAAAVASPSAVAPTPVPSLTPSPSPALTDTPADEATPTPLTPGAVMQSAGAFHGHGQSGLWAASNTRLYLSVDGGASWTSADLPTPAPEQQRGPIEVLDGTHAWIAGFGPLTKVNGKDYAPLQIFRTSDAGRTWASTTIEANFAESWWKVVFADAEHGYLVNGAPTGNDIYRTADGGATWKRTGKSFLGAALVPIGADTLFMYMPGADEMCMTCFKPLLQVSRNGGATWSTIALPGYAGRRTAGDFGVAGLEFLTPSDGFVALRERNFATQKSSLTVFATHDGGRTWSRAATGDEWIDTFWVFDSNNWMGIDSTVALVTTPDAGKTWQKTVPPGVADWDLYNLPSFADSRHGLRSVGVLQDQDWIGRSIEVTQDGGLTWTRAAFPK